MVSRIQKAAQQAICRQKNIKKGKLLSSLSKKKSSTAIIGSYTTHTIGSKESETQDTPTLETDVKQQAPKSTISNSKHTEKMPDKDFENKSSTSASSEALNDIDSFDILETYCGWDDDNLTPSEAFQTEPPLETESTDKTPLKDNQNKPQISSSSPRSSQTKEIPEKQDLPQHSSQDASANQQTEISKGRIQLNKGL